MDVSGTYRRHIGDVSRAYRGISVRIRTYRDVSKLSGYSDTLAGVSSAHRTRITLAPISDTGCGIFWKNQGNVDY
jgi:hypothetical protein